MRDLTACGVFWAGRQWHAACYDHETIWSGPNHPDTRAGLDRAIAEADQHSRVEHPEDV